MFFLIHFFWFLKTAKYIFFWLYLWQLKSYHIPRFIDHFRTEKGKKLIFNYFLLMQVVLLSLFIFAPQFSDYLAMILLVIYLAQSFIFIKQLFTKSVKMPVITRKALFLLGVSFAGLVLYFFWSLEKNLAWLLMFDIVLVVIISAIVLLFQPIAVYMRNNMLEKAKLKMASLANVKVVAIVGSYGKTSTKEFLTTILSKKYKVLATKENQNSEIGIANCILHDLSSDHEIFVAEVGAYDKGKIKEVCDILNPSIGIVTGVNEQHLALFGSMENLLSAEGGRELEQVLPRDGLLVLNGNNTYCLDLAKKTDKRKILYTIKRNGVDADIWTEDVSVAKDYISFITRSKNGEISHFRVSVLGAHNVENLLAAITTALELNMSIEEVIDAVKSIQQPQGQMVLFKNRQGIEVIDSSYSANPSGALADLEYLASFGHKKAVVMPCLIELGKKSKEVHLEIGKKIGQVCTMAIITTKDAFEELKIGALAAGLEEKNIIFEESPEKIYFMITSFLTAGDAVLMEGRVPEKLITLLKQ